MEFKAKSILGAFLAWLQGLTFVLRAIAFGGLGGVYVYIRWVSIRGLIGEDLLSAF